jgi:hypothetical protein
MLALSESLLRENNLDRSGPDFFNTIGASETFNEGTANDRFGMQERSSHLVCPSNRPHFSAIAYATNEAICSISDGSSRVAIALDRSTLANFVFGCLDGLKDAARQHIGVALGVAVDRVGDQSQ